MSRPNAIETRGQTTRRAVLDAAYALLGEREAAAIDMAAISARAGLSEAAITRFFATPTHVFRQLAITAMDLVDLPFEEMLLGGAPVETLVDHAIGLLLANDTAADQRLVRLIQRSPDFADIGEASENRVRVAIAAAMQARNPRLPEPVREAAAALITTTVMAGADSLFACSDPEQRSYLRRELMELVTSYGVALMARGLEGSGPD